MDRNHAYPHVLQAMKQIERADWVLADALIKDLPPRTPDIGRQLEHCRDWLSERGYETSVNALVWKRRVANFFPPNTRTYPLPIAVYSEAAKGCDDTATAMARVKEYYELCQGSGARATAHGMRRLLEKPAYRYSPSQFARYVVDAGEEAADAVLDELEKARRERSKAKGRTGGNVMVGKSSADQAYRHAITVTTSLSKMGAVLADDMRHIPESYRRAIKGKLEVEQQRIALLIGVLDGKVPWDQALVKELDRLDDERKRIGAPGYNAARIM